MDSEAKDIGDVDSKERNGSLALLDLPIEIMACILDELLVSTHPITNPWLGYYCSYFCTVEKRSYGKRFPGYQEFPIQALRVCSVFYNLGIESLYSKNTLRITNVYLDSRGAARVGGINPRLRDWLDQEHQDYKNKSADGAVPKKKRAQLIRNVVIQNHVIDRDDYAAKGWGKSLETKLAEHEGMKFYPSRPLDEVVPIICALRDLAFEHCRLETLTLSIDEALPSTLEILANQVAISLGRQTGKTPLRAVMRPRYPQNYFASMDFTPGKPPLQHATSSLRLLTIRGVTDPNQDGQAPQHNGAPVAHLVNEWLAAHQIKADIVRFSGSFTLRVVRQNGSLIGGFLPKKKQIQENMVEENTKQEMKEKSDKGDSPEHGPGVGIGE